MAHLNIGIALPCTGDGWLFEIAVFFAPRRGQRKVERHEQCHDDALFDY
jgi:hypothetical protein